MVLEIKQSPKLVQQLVITPQLQQAIRLLQLTRLELVDMISQEMKENPLLEETDEGEQAPEESRAAEAEEVPQELEHTPEVKGEGEVPEAVNEFDWENYLENYNLTPYQRVGTGGQDGEERPSFENFLVKRTTLADHLHWQLQFSRFTDDEHRVGTWVIGNLDEDGYLKVPLEDIVNDLNVPRETVEKVLRKIQQFDPVGVGARDLRECLLVQLQGMTERNPVAELIVADHLSLLKNRNYPALARRLGVSLEKVNEAAFIISRLEPKPGRAFGGETAQEIIPDVYIYKIEGEYVVYLNDDEIPRLRVNNLYRSILTNSRQVVEEDRKYIQEKLRSALWLIRSIHQRQRTIYRVAKSIVKFSEGVHGQGRPVSQAPRSSGRG